jgi:hypothetical protein
MEQADSRISKDKLSENQVENQVVDVEDEQELDSLLPGDYSGMEVSVSYKL